jgi:nucleoside-diphosphate-sugar epimerase
VPSNLTPLGALPARFRRERVLIVGCGDVGQRVAAALTRRARVLALTSSPERMPALRALGLTPLRGNLDDPSSLRRLAGVATRVLHLAPPPQEGDRDPRTRTLLRVLARRSPPRSLVYGSTSGVYGDCQGAWVMESRPLAPFTRRAMRRVDAEDAVRHWGRRQSGIARAMVLRIPGIYAPDRPGGTPRDRLLRGTPVLQQQDDVYTNHIHANDLARACDLALWRTRAQRVMHVSDDSDLQMADYYDLAADMYGLPRPRRLPRQAAESELPLMLLSFMSESRRLDNTRLRRELRLRLRYPTVIEGLQEDPRVLKRP